MYHILLILTDGIIFDMKEVKDLIVENCHLQVSIIIVGIGEDDFDKMIELDGDNIILTDSKNKKAVRD